MARHHYREGEEPVPGYRLSRWLGEGGFGVAWMATAPGGTEVALKIIDLGAKNARKEFRALRLVKRIRHPNLTPIISFWMKDSEGFLLDDTLADTDELLSAPSSSRSLKDTMMVNLDPNRAQPAELIIAMGLGDKSLSDRLDECRAAGEIAIQPDELLQYMEDAARAIDHLNSPQHDLGDGPVAIQHCDIKPQNILIVGGAAQVCDFGLARALDDTRATKVAVSYAYAAPESFQNKPSSTTDQYSLAVSYVELRTGELPFEDESAVGVMNAHLEGKLDLSRLEEQERAVIARATSLNPKDRYDSALKMVRALRRAYEQSSESVSDLEPAKPTPSKIDTATASDVIVPGYHLVRQLVRGGSEEVWEATAPGGKPVALVVRELADTAQALDLEALALAPKLEHPHLTEMLSYWLIDSSGQVVPDELRTTVDKGTLHRLVVAGRLVGKTLLQCLGEHRQATGQGIPLPELLNYMDDAATGIDFLNGSTHRVGKQTCRIMHCNLQPTNVLLYGDVVKIGNLGRARLIEGDSLEDSIAAAGFEMSYTPPEVFEGRLTRWTDQYGLAITYVHLRSGKPAFDAANSTTRLIEIHRSGQLNLRDLPAEEAAVVRRATALHPEDRYDSCGAFVQALRKATAESAAPPKSPPPASSSAPTAAPPEPSKTAPLATMVTEEFDLSATANYDTTPEDDRSVIETQTVREPRPADRPEPVAPRPAAPGWRPAPAEKSKPSKVGLLVGGLLVVAALGAGGFWYSSSSEPTPGASEDDPVAVVDSADAVVPPRVANEDEDDDAAPPEPSDPFVPRVTELLANVWRMPPEGQVDPATLIDELIALRENPDAERALAARRRDVQNATNEIKAKVREMAARRASEPDVALSLLDKVLLLDPADPVALLHRAQLAYAAQRYDASRESLDTLRTLSVDRSTRLEAVILRLWLDSTQTDTPTAAVLDTLSQASRLIAEGTVPSKDVAEGLAVELGEMADRDPELQEPAIGLMAQLYRTYPEESIGRWYAQSLRSRLRQRLSAEGETDWRAIEADSQAITDRLEINDPLARAAWAESRIEQSNIRSALQPDHLLPHSLLDSAAIEADWLAYVAYVEALVHGTLGREPNWELAQPALDKLSEQIELLGPEAPGMSAESRRRQAAELFNNAALHLRVTERSLSPVERLLALGFADEETARRAARYLDAATKLGADPTPEQSVVLAQAALMAGDLPRAREAAELALAGQELGDDAGALRWLAARTQEDSSEGRAAALEQYAAILDGLAEDGILVQLDGSDAIRLHDELLEPALETAGQLDEAATAELASQIARLHAARGDLMLDENLAAEWELGKTERMKRALDSFNAAIELDPARADYYVGRGQSRWTLKDAGGADAALADVELALERNDSLAGAYKLRGYVFSAQARESCQNAEKVRLFKDARVAFELALENAEPGDPDRTDYLIGLCNTHVNLGNYQPQQHDEHLHKAENYGQEAVKDRGSKYLELAFRALGNAQEDLAWIGGRGDAALEEYFARAVDSFRAATSIRPDLGAAWRDVGRVQYKWIADATTRDDDRNRADLALQYRDRLRTDAEGNLQQALRKDPNLNDARYWLAMTLYRQGRAAEGSDVFREYFDHENFYANYGAEWANWTLARLAGLHDAIDQGLSIDSPEAQADLTAAKQCAAQLRTLADVKLDERCGTALSFDPEKEARAIDALVTVLEGSADKTLAELIVAVPQLDAATPSDMSMLVARVHARLRTSKSAEADEARVPLVIRDSLKITTLATLPRSRQVAGLATSGWAHYKACNFPRAQGAQQDFHAVYRQLAIAQYRALLGIDAHHPDSWMWRRLLARLLKEEIDAELPNAAKLGQGGEPATAETLRSEAVAQVDYALELAPQEERARLRRLKSDLAKR